MDWRGLATKLLLADQRISERETEFLRQAVSDHHAVDREEIEFLVSLKRQAEEVHPSFDHFLFAILKKVVLRDGVIGDGEARWLRSMILRDNEVSREETRFIEELHRSARETGPEFQRLYQECTSLSGVDFAG